ncbi:MAG: DNA mismatch repair endonuclease MutH [Gammaproteobacteria bacterium]|nr:DNA mismatch repair endonuclease MutH [Gammaproteobacteria bacterium]
MVERPYSEQQLLDRAQMLAGLTLSQVANDLGLEVPQSLRRNKGWIGNLLELALGATAGSKPQQDFPELGIELKSIPINAAGKPLETTYVCITPLTGIGGLTWAQSNIFNKLKKVLWIPILSDKSLAIGDRQIGSPFIWQPNEREQCLMQQDWEEIMELIALGEINTITAKIGQVLQLRPKGANAKALTKGVGRDGETIMTLPRGFYLKIPFTHQILIDQFKL